MKGHSSGREGRDEIGLGAVPESEVVWRDKMERRLKRPLVEYPVAVATVHWNLVSVLEWRRTSV